MRKQDGVQLNCFSPPVMIATMAVEVSLAAYTIWRYKLNHLVRLVIAMLVGLAVFQLAEYFVCTGLGSMAGPWSRVGFVTITALPPLGLHIMHILADKPGRRLVNTAYASMAVYSLFFIFTPDIFTGHECTGNYVIFQFTANVTGVYTVYYFGWLLAGMGLGFRWANQLMAGGESKLRRLESVQGMVLGYLVFLIPSAIAMAVRPDARRGIPSVLCGFAVLLAFMLTFYILPKAAPQKISKLDKTA